MRARARNSARDATWLLVAALLVHSTGAAAVEPSYSGSWYRPSESGSGFNLEIFEEERALLYWYTYDDAGEPVWLYSEGAIDGDRIDFDVYYADGMRFSDLDTADKVNRPWGTLTMTFQDCDHATISYESTLEGLPHSPVGARDLPVERLVNLLGLPCRRKGSGYWAGTHYIPASGANHENLVVPVSGVFAADGRLFLDSDSGYAMVGTYEAGGDGITFVYRSCYNTLCEVVHGASTDFADRQGMYLVENPDSIYEPHLDLAYGGIYDLAVTVASLQGAYRLQSTSVDNVFINGLGMVRIGEADGCLIDGTLVQPDAAYDVFDFLGTSSCEAGAITGVVVKTEPAFVGPATEIQIILSSEARVRALRASR